MDTTGYAFSRVIHRIQCEKLFGKPDWYMGWLGAIDRLWKSYLLASPFGCQPSGLHSATPSPCCGEGAASGPTGRVPPHTYRDSGGS